MMLFVKIDFCLFPYLKGDTRVVLDLDLGEVKNLRNMISDL